MGMPDGPGRPIGSARPVPQVRDAINGRYTRAEEYPVDMTVSPAAPKPGDEITLQFRVKSPHGHDAKLQLIHEKVFHLFLVSKDLSVFRHEHPQLQADGSLLHRTVLPKGGMYRYCATSILRVAHRS